jgi:dimethylamine corrinoid protein
VDRVEALIEAVVELDEPSALELVDELLAGGAMGSAVIKASCAALEIVGERYERQEYFLSALIVAGEIFKNVVDRVGEVAGSDAGAAGGGARVAGGSLNVSSARVLLGTVEGDIHDLGKNIVATVLIGLGFTVRDVGVDVAPACLVEEALEFRPDIIGLSGLLIPTAVTSMRKTIDAVRAEWKGGGDCPSVIIGGNVDKAVADYVGADTWTTDAVEGARICQRLLEARATRAIGSPLPT